MRAERPGFRQQFGDNVLHADDTGAACLDEFDGHFQHRIVATREQRLQHARHLGERLQCRLDVTPFRTAANAARHDDAVDALRRERPR